MTRRNEWNETLEQTIEHGQAQRGLLVYSLMPDEEIGVTINGESRDGIQIEDDRVLQARCLDSRIGKLLVTEDTAFRENWAGREICLGSYVFSLGSMELARGGLLRGMIALGQGVAVDFTAQHFATAPPNYLLAEYRALDLQGHRIF